jgi:hypothetical protein
MLCSGTVQRLTRSIRVTILSLTRPIKSYIVYNVLFTASTESDQSHQSLGLSVVLSDSIEPNQANQHSGQSAMFNDSKSLTRPITV